MSLTVEEHTQYQKYVAFPNRPVISNIDDTGNIYDIEIHQKDIIYSEDIYIVLDYNKDYPTRLFQSFEIYYDNKLIASNLYPEYLMIEDKKIYSIFDLFPQYRFVVNTKNKSLKFRFTRNSIKGVANSIRIEYLIDKTKIDDSVKLVNFATILSPAIQYCKKCKCYKFSFIVEHKPQNQMFNLMVGHISDENYSTKPIYELKGKVDKHYHNDELIVDSEPKEGMNVYYVEADHIKDLISAVLYYVY
jgi:hypothetical protein